MMASNVEAGLKTKGKKILLAPIVPFRACANRTFMELETSAMSMLPGQSVIEYRGSSQEPPAQPALAALARSPVSI